MTSYLDYIWTGLRVQVRQLQDDDAGYSTEAVVVTAALAALALLVAGVIIWDKVVAKAESIDLSL